ncbi:hypothetical protein ANTQUA_LOCUS4173 [Anthophora quadrimaculata]
MGVAIQESLNILWAISTRSTEASSGKSSIVVGALRPSGPPDAIRYGGVASDVDTIQCDLSDTPRTNLGPSEKGSVGRLPSLAQLWKAELTWRGTSGVPLRDLSPSSQCPHRSPVWVLAGKSPALPQGCSKPACVFVKGSGMSIRISAT